jgi:hypothetical protein
MPMELGEILIRSIASLTGAVTLEIGTEIAPEGKRIAPAIPLSAASGTPLEVVLAALDPLLSVLAALVVVAEVPVAGVVVVPVVPVGSAGIVGSGGIVTVGRVGSRSARAAGMHTAATAPSTATADKAAQLSRNRSRAEGRVLTLSSLLMPVGM